MRCSGRFIDSVRESFLILIPEPVRTAPSAEKTRSISSSLGMNTLLTVGNDLTISAILSESAIEGIIENGNLYTSDQPEVTASDRVRPIVFYLIERKDRS